MKVHAFAPCTRPESMSETLKDVLNQSVVPNYIVVVDNGEGETLYSYKPKNWWHLNYPGVRILNFGKNLGPNHVWNMALHTSADYAMLFPDDMRFDLCFVQKALRIFEDNRVGVVSAKIIAWEEELPGHMENNLVCRRKEGHGRAGIFMIRGEVARLIPPIPKCFFIFYGDDWIDYWCRIKLKKLWVELVHSCARHEYGSGVSATLRKSVLLRERRHWNRFLEREKECGLSISS